MNMELVFGTICLSIGERTLQGCHLLRAQRRLPPFLESRSVRGVEFLHENFTLTRRRSTSHGYRFPRGITYPNRRTVLRWIVVWPRAAQAANKKNSDNSI